MTRRTRSSRLVAVQLCAGLLACSEAQLESQRGADGPASPTTPGSADPGRPTPPGAEDGPGGAPSDPPAGGSDSGAPPPPFTAPPVLEDPNFAPAAARLVRLTRAQYETTLRALFWPDLVVPADLENDTPLHGFTTIGGSELTVSPRAAEQFEAAAADVARQFVADPARRVGFTGCEPTLGDDTCARTFLTGFLRRAFRRAVDAEEVEAFVALTRQVGETLRDPWQGLAQGVSAALQSPDLLYRVEVGEPDPDRAGGRRHTGFEMASRLSYFLWNGPPDDALLDAAEQGRLVTDDGVRAEATRLLEDPRAETALVRFFGEYVNLERVDGLQRDPAIFPQMSATLAASMRGEIEALFRDVAFTRNAEFAEVLTSRRLFVNAELAALYGLPFPIDTPEDAWVPVDLPGNHPRGGLLGTAGVLAANAHRTVTSPTLRGKFIQNALLCFDVPPPPPGVTTSLGEDVPGAPPKTTREKIAQHAADPTCNGCHQFMDPLGLALEHFDALGAYRTTEYGLPIDASGELAGAEFRDLGGLARVLRGHPDVGACLVRRMYRYATGHLEEFGEEPALRALYDRLAAGGYRVRDTALQLVLSPGFRLTSEGLQ